MTLESSKNLSRNRDKDKTYPANLALSKSSITRLPNSKRIMLERQGIQLYSVRLVTGSFAPRDSRWRMKDLLVTWCGASLGSNWDGNWVGLPVVRSLVLSFFSCHSLISLFPPIILIPYRSMEAKEYILLMAENCRLDRQIRENLFPVLQTFFKKMACLFFNLYV